MYRRILLLLALAIPIAACEDASAPNGNDSTVLVRAYVDANGSGVFDAGDVPISDAAVTLRSNTTGAVLNATTDDAGLATFANVDPGSYSASLGGNAPAGALLATGATPTVVAPFEGGEVSGEFRFVFVPGSLAGVLFRDNNGNGVFDLGIDTPAPGMLVELFAGAPLTGAPIAETTTSASGAFSFGGLRPGLYTVVLHPLPTMDILEGDTIPVTVTADAALPMPLVFTGALISTIGEVRDTAFADSAGTRFDVVAVEGVVHTAQGTFRTDNAFIQDATGGMLLFNVPATAGLEVGDSVRVIAAIDWFNGELELVRISSTAPPVIEHLGTAAAPQPRVISGAQMLSRDYEGQLVQLTNAVVDSVGTATSAGAYTVWVITGDGQRVQVRIENTSIGIAAGSWVIGRRYDIAGALSHFRGAPQLKPRGAADVVAGSVAMPIGTARLQAAGDTVLIEGVASVGVGIFSTSTTGNQFNLQDATGGILILDTPLASGIAQGDSLRVEGVLQVSSGELVLRSPQITDLGTGTVIAPQFITGQRVAASTATDPLQGSLVAVNSVTVTAVSGTATSTAYNVTVQDEDGATFIVRVGSANVGIAQTYWQIGSRYDVTGTLGNFNGAQVKVRSAADVTASTVAPITIGAARAVTPGDTVLVEGVVTAPVGVFSTSTTGNQFNIQDATGGVLILDTPLASGIQLGEYVRVRAATQVSAGEFVLRGPVITRLGWAPVPAPQTITALQVQGSTATGNIQGELVRVENVTVTAVSGTATSTSYNVTVLGADGGTFIVRVGSANVGIPQTYWQVGSAYDVTGTLGNFNGAQVKLRFASDVVAR